MLYVYLCNFITSPVGIDFFEAVLADLLLFTVDFSLLLNEK